MHWTITWQLLFLVSGWVVGSAADSSDASASHSSPNPSHRVTQLFPDVVGQWGMTTPSSKAKPKNMDRDEEEEGEPDEREALLTSLNGKSSPLLHEAVAHFSSERIAAMQRLDDMSSAPKQNAHTHRLSPILEAADEDPDVADALNSAFFEDNILDQALDGARQDERDNTRNQDVTHSDDPDTLAAAFWFAQDEDAQVEAFKEEIQEGYKQLAAKQDMDLEEEVFHQDKLSSDQARQFRRLNRAAALKMRSQVPPTLMDRTLSMPTDTKHDPWTVDLPSAAPDQLLMPFSPTFQTMVLSRSLKQFKDTDHDVAIEVWRDKDLIPCEEKCQGEYMTAILFQKTGRYQPNQKKEAETPFRYEVTSQVQNVTDFLLADDLSGTHDLLPQSLIAKRRPHYFEQNLIDMQEQLMPVNVRTWSMMGGPHFSIQIGDKELNGTYPSAIIHRIIEHKALLNWQSNIVQAQNWGKGPSSIMYTDVLPKHRYKKNAHIPAMVKRHQKSFTFAREDTLCYLNQKSSYQRAMHVIDKVLLSFVFSFHSFGIVY